MADEVISTKIVADADFSGLIADVHKVTASLSKLQENLANSNKMLANNVAVINRNFADTIRSTGQFSSHFVSLTSDVEKFGKNLDSGRLKLRDYFNTYQGHIKTSGGLIRDLAKQQVAMQNAILQPLGRNAQGLMQFNVHVPRGLDAIKNKTSIARQELQIMNKVIQDGAVQLINWGKNTQWAGRQLTVGLTLPLAAFGKAAADAFKVADQELTRLTKVYGDVAGTSAQELGKVRAEVVATAKELSAAYGTNFSETISLAADIAATGKQGQELLNSVKETSRLAVLGEVDRQEAMKATLAIQSAFKSNTEELANSINFLNAVENQTSTTLNDLVEAIPKAGPVIKGLGGSVQDLALYLTAMREGGISASEGANALKSALASLINPTDKAVDKFKSLGIDLLGIVNNNAGNVTATLLELQSALDSLNPLQKQQAIEQLFGKFQFSRLNALFENLGRQGSQTLQVLDLMKASTADLANVAGRELTAVTESASGKYRRALESLKADLAGVGEQFLTIGTKIINIVDKALEFFNGLPKPVKTALTFLGALTAVAGPLIMLTGLLANFFGYILKGAMHMKAFFKGGEGWKYLTPEMIAAEKAGKMLEQTFYSDAKAASILQLALKNLIDEFSILEAKAKSGAISVNPAVSTMGGNLVMGAGGRVVNPQHPLAGPMGTRASTHMVPRAALSEEQRMQQTIFGLVPGSIPVNRKIGDAPQIYMNDPLPPVPGLTTIGGVSTGVVAGEAARHHAMMATLAMQSKSEIEMLKKQIATTGVVSKDFMNQFDDILPIVSGITDNAAKQSSLIVAELRAGKLTVEQARAQIIALNLEIERMITGAVSAQAASMGRTINPTMVPTLNQPVVDATGKSNMRELFKKSKTRDLIDKVARSLGVRTSGAGYNIETTKPRKMNMGGYVYTMNDGNIVPGPDVNSDVVPAMLTPGEFVVNREATAANLPLLMTINEGYNMGGKVRRGVSGYRQIAASLRSLRNAHSQEQRRSGTVQTSTRNTIGSLLMEALSSNRERALAARTLYRQTPSGIRHQDRAHIGRSVAEMAAAQTPFIYKKFFGVASVNPFNKIQQGLSRAIGSKDVNPVTDITAVNKTLPEIFTKIGAGTWWKNLGAPGGKINPQEVDAYLRHLSSYASGKSRWQSLPYGKIPRDLITAMQNGSIGRNDFQAYVKYLMSGTVKQTNRLGIIANDAAALVELKKMSPEMAIAEATRIYETTLGDKNISDSQYMRARAIHTSTNYPEFVQQFRPRNRRNLGGMIRGYNRGGIVYANKGQFIKGVKQGYKGKGGPGIDPTGGMASSMAGMGLMMGGQMVGQTNQALGQSMQITGMLLQFMPMLKMLGGFAKGFTTLSGTILKFGSIVGRTALFAKNVLTVLTGPIGLIAAGLTAIIALGIKIRNDNIKKEENQTSLFGMSTKAAKELGIEFTTLSDKMKAVREEQKLMADKARAQFESYTSAGVTGLSLTIKELKELKERVKTDMPEVLKTLNNIDSSQLNQWAANIKAQMISAGKSVQEANNLIYALIESSNKAGMGVKALTDKAFNSIQDKGSAASFIIQTLADNFDKVNEIDSDAFASNIDTAVSSMDNAVQALIGTKDAQGKIIDEADALMIIYERMNDLKVKDKELTADVLKTIQKERPELAAILNSSDTIGGMYAKWRLYLQGVKVDLASISSEQAETLAQFAAGLDAAGAAALTVGGGVEGLGAAAAVLEKLKAAYAAANKAANQEGNSKKLLDKATIRSIQNEIKAIRERAEAKKKALRETFDKENAELELQQAKLDLQNAIARGDNEAAAAAQIRIQQIQKEASLKAAEAKIDENARKAEAKEQKKLDDDQALRDSLAQSASKAGKTADNLGGTINLVDSIGKEVIRVAKRQSLEGNTESVKMDVSNVYKKIADNASNQSVRESFGQFLERTARVDKQGKPVLDKSGQQVYDYKKDAKGNYIPIPTTKLDYQLGYGLTTTTPGLDQLSKLSGSMSDFAIKITGDGKKTLSDIYNILSKNQPKSIKSVAKDYGDINFNKWNPATWGNTDNLARLLKDNSLKKGDAFEYKGITYDVTNTSGVPTVAARKALGGYVRRAANGITGMISSQPYLVGERGPELFVPSSGGQIIPNNILGARYNIPSNTISGINGSANNSYNNNTYTINIELNGTNVTADDIMRKFKAELALINAKEGRSRAFGGSY